MTIDQIIEDMTVAITQCATTGLPTQGPVLVLDQGAVIQWRDSLKAIRRDIVQAATLLEPVAAMLEAKSREVTKE